ncbi:hypothetical protein HLB44_10055 [Aquincola sp. S2]|uniref:Uncharacterized protein n=1 Tax=Pseudaquabacterium terrae TaxID=2732868 RepID=A0ABX2EFD9_9BURK|nr:hypothetical protein [Aquabacterium terrae]NRF67327.1 hypothetical protein [Aquabacterium terrae]
MKKPRHSMDDLLPLVVIAFSLLCAVALVFDLQAPADTFATQVQADLPAWA